MPRLWRLIAALSVVVFSAWMLAGVASAGTAVPTYGTCMGTPTGTDGTSGTWIFTETCTNVNFTAGATYKYMAFGFWTANTGDPSKEYTFEVCENTACSVDMPRTFTFSVTVSNNSMPNAASCSVGSCKAYLWNTALNGTISEFSSNCNHGTAPTTAADSNWACMPYTGGQSTWTYTGIGFNSSNGWTNGFSSGGYAPCTLVSITGNLTSPTEVNDGSGNPKVWDYTVTFEGTVNALVADDDYEEGTATYAATAFHGKTFAADYTGVDDNPMYSPTIVGAVTVVGHSVNPDFWCYSASGGWVQWGEVSTLSGTPGQQIGTVTGGGVPVSGEAPTTGNFNVAACFDNAASTMSLWDPFSWVTGGLSMGACVAQWLFIPSEASLSSLQHTFGITTNAPTGSAPASQWLGAMAKGVVAFPYASVSSIQSTADAGGCSLSPLNQNVTLDTHSISACTVLDSLSGVPSAGATAIAWISVILAAVIYVFGGLLLFHFIKEMIQQ